MPDPSLRVRRWLVAALALAGGLEISSCAPPDAVSRNAGPANTRRRDAGPPDHVDPFAGWRPPDGDQPPVPLPPEPTRDAGAAPIDPPASAPPAGQDAGPLPGELLNVSYAATGSATTDLGVAGMLDWVHFGFQGENAINRKRNPTSPLILMSPLGPALLARSRSDSSRFAWTDGTPVQMARAVQSGFETGRAEAGGFQVTVQGDPGQPRTVQLYVGAEAGGARLTARLGNAGLPGYLDRTLTGDSLERNRVYTILFRPGAAERNLTLEWTIEPGGSGSVRIQAVTLSGVSAPGAPAGDR